MVLMTTLASLLGVGYIVDRKTRQAREAMYVKPRQGHETLYTARGTRAPIEYATPVGTMVQALPTSEAPVQPRITTSEPVLARDEYLEKVPLANGKALPDAQTNFMPTFRRDYYMHNQETVDTRVPEIGNAWLTGSRPIDNSHTQPWSIVGLKPDVIPTTSATGTIKVAKPIGAEQIFAEMRAKERSRDYMPRKTHMGDAVKGVIYPARTQITADNVSGPPARSGGFNTWTGSKRDQLPLYAPRTTTQAVVGQVNSSVAGGIGNAQNQAPTRESKVYRRVFKPYMSDVPFNYVGGLTTAPKYLDGIKRHQKKELREIAPLARDVEEMPFPKTANGGMAMTHGARVGSKRRDVLFQSPVRPTPGMLAEAGGAVAVETTVKRRQNAGLSGRTGYYAPDYVPVGVSTYEAPIVAKPTRSTRIDQNARVPIFSRQSIIDKYSKPPTTGLERTSTISSRQVAVAGQPTMSKVIR